MSSQDGRIAIVHLDPYHVEIVDAEGRLTRGPTILDAPITLPEEHKQEWREQWTRIASGPGSQARSAPEPPSWPDYLPPVLPGAVHVSVDGSVWVERTTAAPGPTTYDVFDARAQRVQQVTFPHGSHVAGFGTGAVYVTRITDDGLQYLQRFRLPDAANR